MTFRVNTQDPLGNSSVMPPQDVQTIVNLFREQRISLRYTQRDVARQLSEMTEDSFHQTFISKLECNKLEFDTMVTLTPILQRWLAETKTPKTTGVRLCRKRKKPKRLSEEALLLLRSVYEQTPKPSDEQIHELSVKLRLESPKIKAWFSNRKKSLKRKQSSNTHKSSSLQEPFSLLVLSKTDSSDIPWILDVADNILPLQGNQTSFQNNATQTEQATSQDATQCIEIQLLDVADNIVSLQGNQTRFENVATQTEQPTSQDATQCIEKQLIDHDSDIH